jgi:predicted nucleic acid-binding protein
MGPAVASESLIDRRIYVDANVFIYGLEKIEPWSQHSARILGMIDNGTVRAVTSELTLAECLVAPFKNGRDDLAKLYETAIQSREHLVVSAVSRSTLIEAALLRATSTFRLPDAIHAATCLGAKCDIMLTNDNGFAGLPGVTVMTLGEIPIS